MAEVGTAWVNVVPSAKGFGRAVEKQVAPQMRSVGSTVGSTFAEGFTRDASGRLRDSRGRFVAAGTQIGQSMGAGVGDGFFRDVNGRLRDARGRFVAEGNALGQSLGRGTAQGVESSGGGSRVMEWLSKGASSIATGVGVAIGQSLMQGVGSIVTGGITRLLNLEDARKRLDLMGLGAEEVEALMAGLNDVLQGTPYALDAGATAMSNFVSSGFDLDKIPDFLNMAADAAAFGQADFGEVANIFRRIGTNGKLSAYELEMLGDRGIPALNLLSDAAGVSALEFRKMMRNNEVSADDFFRWWEKGAEGFGENNVKMAGAAKGAGETTRGAWANLQTAMSRFGATILGPVMGPIADLFRSMTEGIDAVGRKWKEWSADLDLSGVVTRLRSEAGEIAQPITDALAGVDWGEIGADLLSTWEDISTALARVDWAGIWKGAKEAAAPVVEALVEIGAAVSVLVQEVWPLLVEGFKTAWPVLKILGTIVAAVGFVLHKWFVVQLRAVAAAIRVAATVISWFGRNVTLPVLRLVATYVQWVWNAVLLPTFRALSTFVSTVLVPVFQFLGNIFRIVWAAISAAVSIAWMLIQPILSALWSFVSTVLAPVFQLLWDRVRAAWDGVWLAIQVAWNLIRPIFDRFREAVAAVADWVSEHVDEIVSFFEGLPDKIGDALSGLKDKILAPFERALDAVKDLWNSTMGNLSLPSIPGLGSINIPGFHTGGVVPGRAGQEVFSVLKAGEVVLSRPQVAAAYRGLHSAPSFAPISGVGGGETVTLHVPLIVNGREFARATVNDMAAAAEQQRKMRS